MAKHSANILELARRGAQARYEELITELESLSRQFPNLRAGAREVVKRGRRAVKAAAAELTAETPKRARNRKPMSAAAKKAVSARMKKYWAARRNAKKS
jgi:hypothetical protein